MVFPDTFREKMQALLGAEYEAFAASYDKPRRRGLRVNVSKISPEEFVRIAPFPLEPILWVENGFFYSGDVRPARHPYYAAGLYYLQEPSAMTPASRLPLAAGDRVLDLCAAPGGKATELAARLAVPDRRGILVANDISQQRAKALLHNLEVTGTDNYCVLNETPERLAAAFPQFFDKILVDAPCSGEGMFRKEEEALRLWSPERVADFAAQQKKILDQAYAMLRPGGLLLYSTCTFSPEENEQQIAAFLARYPDMEMQEIEQYEGFSEGRPDWVRIPEVFGQKETFQIVAENNTENERITEIEKDLKKCVRIWPHRMDGEGHFLALMKKTDPSCGCFPENRISDTEGVWEASGTGRDSGERTGRSRGKKAGDRKQKKGKRPGETSDRPDREQSRLLSEFLCDITGSTAEAEALCRDVQVRQEKAFLPGPAGEKLGGLHVMRGGTYLGEWKKNRFEPSQAFAMTLAAAEKRISFAPEDPRLTKYLAGETFPAEGLPDGWLLVCVESFPVGWAKVVRGVAKNHYPASWRSV